MSAVNPVRHQILIAYHKATHRGYRILIVVLVIYAIGASMLGPSLAFVVEVIGAAIIAGFGIFVVIPHMAYRAASKIDGHDTLIENGFYTHRDLHNAYIRDIKGRH